MRPVLPMKDSVFTSLNLAPIKLASSVTVGLLVPRWNFEVSPCPGPRRAKAVLGHGSVGVAGIDVETFTGDKVRVVGRQKDRRAKKLFRFTQSAERNSPQAFSRFFSCSGKSNKRSADERIYIDAIVSQGLGNRAGHRLDAGVSHAVTRRLTRADPRVGRRKIDNFAAPLLSHLPAHSLAGKEVGLGAALNTVVERFLGES